MNSLQLDLFGFEAPPKKAIIKPIFEPREAYSLNHEQLIQVALKRLQNECVDETEQVIRDWVHSDWYHGLNPNYHVAAYNISLLKTLKVDDETIIQQLLVVKF